MNYEHIGFKNLQGRLGEHRGTKNNFGSSGAGIGGINARGKRCVWHCCRPIWRGQSRMFTSMAAHYQLEIATQPKRAMYNLVTSVPAVPALSHRGCYPRTHATKKPNCVSLTTMPLSITTPLSTTMTTHHPQLCHPPLRRLSECHILQYQRLPSSIRSIPTSYMTTPLTTYATSDGWFGLALMLVLLRAVR